MIPFRSLISTIQRAADLAAKSVSDQNHRLLLTYFNRTNSESDGDKETGTNNDLGATFTPKMVALKYPKETVEGPTEHTVYVPLISLAPHSSLNLESMEIVLDLEIIEKDGELQVGFPSLHKNILGQLKTETPKPNAKITMTLSSGSRPPGVSALVEGYDRALRAQIPS